jgi:hypothetical protein
LALPSETVGLQTGGYFASFLFSNKTPIKVTIKRIERIKERTPLNTGLTTMLVPTKGTGVPEM